MIKKFNASLIILGLFCFFGMSSVNALAAFAYEGYVHTKTDLKVGPGANYPNQKTNSNKDAIAYPTNTVDMYTNKIYADEGGSCPAGWYQGVYATTNLIYVCSSHMNPTKLSGIDTIYNRPWTTPKKSIVGGAKFIGESYIEIGQFTNYLQKFNVNPKNKKYALYTHQYMANLIAPYSEARTAYNTYKSNNLLNNALVFSIPVFNSMPEETTLAGFATKNPGKSNITDSAFEASLNAQGFPESYKKKLRYIHDIHPNWIFEAMFVGDDFINAINAEMKVSSIQFSPNDPTDPENFVYCIVVNNQCAPTEESGTWKVSSAITQYFLDPRNFIEDERILMFQKLTYNDVYNESAVQKIIANTFMKDKSALDNQSYASIFVEAGKTQNINPIYLASRVVQEVGTNGSSVTTGEQFSYKGLTLKGVYNFYNIGAYGSEPSPRSAALIWANGGSTATFVNNENPGDGDSGGSTPPPTPEIDPIPSVVASKLRVNGSYVSNIGLGATVNNFKSAFSGYNVYITNSNNQGLSNNSLVGTGSLITISNGTYSHTYTAVIYGDENGDGIINSADLLKVRQHLLGIVNLNSAYNSAGDVNRDGIINSADLLKIRQHLLGISKINQ